MSCWLSQNNLKNRCLGILFRSSIFPEENIRGETRLTAMVRPETQEPLQAALEALEQHLAIHSKPIYTSSFLAKEAIPQFEVGCGYEGAVSVDGCIARGEALNIAGCC